MFRVLTVAVKLVVAVLVSALIIRSVGEMFVQRNGPFGSIQMVVRRDELFGSIKMIVCRDGPFDSK